jgi:hypothetical protein
VTDHPQVRVLRDGEPVEIDAGLVNIVRALWRLGYDTISSCQHVTGSTVAYVAFRTLADGERFVSEFGGTLLETPGGAAVVWPPAETVKLARNVTASARLVPTPVPTSALENPV